MPKTKDITGKRFGKLIATKKTDKKAGHRGYVWECKCDCGNISFVAIGDLTSGNTQSCGCVLKEFYKSNNTMIPRTEMFSVFFVKWY